MGCCCAQPDDDNDSSDKETKILLLGSGFSGRSTFLKQLITIHGAGFADKDKAGYRDHICSQILEQMRLAIDHYDILDDDYESLPQQLHNAIELVFNQS